MLANNRLILEAIDKSKALKYGLGTAGLAGALGAGAYAYNNPQARQAITNGLNTVNNGIKSAYNSTVKWGRNTFGNPTGTAATTKASSQKQGDYEDITKTYGRQYNSDGSPHTHTNLQAKQSMAADKQADYPQITSTSPRDNFGYGSFNSPQGQEVKGVYNPNPIPNLQTPVYNSTPQQLSTSEAANKAQQTLNMIKPVNKTDDQTGSSGVDYTRVNVPTIHLPSDSGDDNVGLSHT